MNHLCTGNLTSSSLLIDARCLKGSPGKTKQSDWTRSKIALGGAKVGGIPWCSPCHKVNPCLVSPPCLQRLLGNDIPPSDVEEMQEYASSNVELRAVAEVTRHNRATMMSVLVVTLMLILTAIMTMTGAAVGGAEKKVGTLPFECNVSDKKAVKVSFYVYSKGKLFHCSCP